MSAMFEVSDPYIGTRWWSESVADGIPPRPQGRRNSEDSTFDVVVVGGGASGHVISLFLDELGRSVVMLEAAGEGGGTAYKSAAGMWFPDNSVMRERGIEPDREWAIGHMARLAHPDRYDASAERLGLSEREFELIEAYYAASRPASDALARVGVRVMEFPSITGRYEAMVEYHSDTDHGYGTHLGVQKPDGTFGLGIHFTAQLAELAAARDIDLRVEHRVSQILTDAEGDVVGVMADTPAGPVEYLARQAVVFATGGYPHSPELMAKYFAQRMYGACAVPTARGDFIAMAEPLGAQLENMGCGWGTQHPLEQMLADREVQEHIGVFPGDSMLMVNTAGERVVSEKLTYHERSQVHYERAEDGTLPNHLLFVIYDDWVAFQPADQPNRWPSPEPHEPWVITGATLEQLAERIDARLASYSDRIDGVRLPPRFTRKLADTVERFNAFARNGVDEDFHRGETDVELDWTGPSHADNDRNPAMYPLAGEGPYHAIILVGSVLDTNGGPKADPSGRVLGGDGKPIPSLYGVGNCVASAAGEGYWSGGSTLGPAVVFSYLAARQIAEEPVREPRTDAATA